MPTIPIASAIGMRRKASSIMARRPVSASAMALGGHLARAALAGNENLEDVHQAGKEDHRRHEVHEWPDGDAQDIGRIAVAGDAAGLDHHLPGKKEEHHRHERVYEAHK